MKYRLTARAARDLRNIADFLDEQNPAAAARVLARLERTLELIATAPTIGRVSARPGTREFPVGRFPFLVVYRIEEAQVSVLTIFHTSRNPAEK
ncbi:MAG: type II toxin-antitoxin system RelE/ParE family toxin [Pseudomonadota bacterium]